MTRILSTYNGDSNGLVHFDLEYTTERGKYYGSYMGLLSEISPEPYRGQYIAACSACWANAGHTAALHDERAGCGCAPCAIKNTDLSVYSPDTARDFHAGSDKPHKTCYHGPSIHA